MERHCLDSDREKIDGETDQAFIPDGASSLVVTMAMWINQLVLISHECTVVYAITPVILPFFLIKQALSLGSKFVQALMRPPSSCLKEAAYAGCPGSDRAEHGFKA